MQQRCQWSAAKAGVTFASKAARCHSCVPVNESRERVGLQSGLLSRQFHVTPLVQDAENECRVFETLEVTTAEKQGKRTRNKICLGSRKTSSADGKTKTLRCGGPTGSCKSLSVHVRCRFADDVPLN